MGEKYVLLDFRSEKQIIEQFIVVERFFGISKCKLFLGTELPQ